MAKIEARGLEFEYEQHGPPLGDELLLVMGLGAQMINWADEFVDELVQRGFHVTRFDNRDVGLSTRLDGLAVPDPIQVAAGLVPPAYTVDDMADDAAAVMDALGIEAAHAVGASMGGFIVQALALRHPQKVLSLTSIMSSTADRDLPGPTPEATALLLAPVPTEREALILKGIEDSRLLMGPRYFDEERARRMRTRAVDRAVSLAGTARQLGACLSQAERGEALAGLRVPALVIHGEIDPLVPYPCGVRTHESIPGSRLLTLPEVGHDIPPDFHAMIASAIAETAAAASGGRAAQALGGGSDGAGVAPGRRLGPG